jgi:hypothetical protein
VKGMLIFLACWAVAMTVIMVALTQGWVGEGF